MACHGIAGWGCFSEEQTKDGAVCWKYAGEGNTHTRTNVAEGLPPETGSGVPMS
jgi:hypothetical protein